MEDALDHQNTAGTQPSALSRNASRSLFAAASHKTEACSRPREKKTAKRPKCSQQRSQCLNGHFGPEDFAQSIEVQVQSTRQQLLDGLHALGMPVVDGLNTVSLDQFQCIPCWFSLLIPVKPKPLNAEKLSSPLPTNQPSQSVTFTSEAHVSPSQGCACFIFAQLRCNIGNAIGSARAAAWQSI